MQVVGGMKILIVDDETPVADTLAMVFRIHGYQVQVAYSAELAIEAIAAWEPDLALLDVMLPGMNGVDLAIALKKSHGTCQTLLFSGYDSAGVLLEEAAKSGHTFEILAKPVHPAEILETVKTLLTTGSRSPQAN